MYVRAYICTYIMIRATFVRRENFVDPEMNATPCATTRENVESARTGKDVAFPSLYASGTTPARVIICYAHPLTSSSSVSAIFLADFFAAAVLPMLFRNSRPENTRDRRREPVATAGRSSRLPTFRFLFQILLHFFFTPSLARITTAAIYGSA